MLRAATSQLCETAKTKLNLRHIFQVLCGLVDALYDTGAGKCATAPLYICKELAKYVNRSLAMLATHLAPRS
ncbi:uncharacterized protein IUM83_09101 [Phytophthora cinnamomi]|uniref:uncharacterized protein n=1 Tax=Phytophthora cinnamomi TaxID=4785 RepID=UPI0035598C2E|nr:hypothetical protein IUM83_09101 [Phytophthora cinnamomi]